MNRTVFLIDGFNLYHSISASNKLYKYKWINLYRLATILTPKSSRITGVYYFTALATWDQNKALRHKLFIRVQEHFGVIPIYGKFKMRDKTCRICHGKYQIPEEKQTDVNIAIKLLTLGFNDEYDTAVIISGDSDLIPSVKAVREELPAKRIGIVIPIHRTAIELQNIADFHMKIKEKHLASCILPEEIEINGRKITRPPTWR